MEVTNHIINILALLVVALHGVYGADTNTVSVTNAGDFSVLPACVQSCLFYNSFGVADYLVEVLGCTRFEIYPKAMFQFVSGIDCNVVLSTMRAIAHRLQISPQVQL